MHETPQNTYDIDSVAFESEAPDRGYTVKASYLKGMRDSLIEIFKDGQPVREFLFPAYKVWNIAAHFSDIVDGEIEKSSHGYEMAAWDGISGATFILPNTVEAPSDPNGLSADNAAGASSENTSASDGDGTAEQSTPTGEQEKDF